MARFLLFLEIIFVSFPYARGRWARIAFFSLAAIAVFVACTGMLTSLLQQRETVLAQADQQRTGVYKAFAAYGHFCRAHGRLVAVEFVRLRSHQGNPPHIRFLAQRLHLEPGRITQIVVLGCADDGFGGFIRDRAGRPPLTVFGRFDSANRFWEATPTSRQRRIT